MGNFEWAWVLGVQKGKVPGQHMRQDLGTLVGRQNSRATLHPTGRAGSGRLGCGAHVLLGTGTTDCPRKGKGGKEVWEGGPLRKYIAGEEWLLQTPIKATLYLQVRRLRPSGLERRN